jgi:ribose-phosphate pyrophosphokinase
MKITKTLPNNEKIDMAVNFWNFPGGEIGVKLSPFNLRYIYANEPKYTTITHRIASSNDFMALALTVDALRQMDDTPIRLVLPYVPYARQDRTCVKGESFSLQVFTKLLNSLELQKVTILDPHSSVTPALINNVRVIDQIEIISKWEDFKKMIMTTHATFVSPDAGSNKKVSDIAGYMQHLEFIRADKLRDLSNGHIKETIVYADDLKGETVVILDDICDGGKTFVELAKVLKKKNVEKIILYVTHGIFSKGLAELYNNGIDEIWTTNSFQTEIVDYPNYPVRDTPKLVPTATLDIETLL